MHPPFLHQMNFPGELPGERPGKRFEFNYDFCKGCGLCAAECPCGAIQMVPEKI